MRTSTKLLFAVMALMLAGCAVGPDTKAAADPAAARQAAADKECVRATGTRIEPKEGKCATVSGRTYTNEDLQRTGAQTLNEAISRLPR